MEQSEWAHMVDQIKEEILNGYLTLIVLKNGDLKVSRDPLNYTWYIVTNEMPEYHAILNVVGPLEPGSWLNARGVIGMFSKPDVTRYVEGKMVEPPGGDYRIVGQTGISQILFESRWPPEMAPDADEFEKCMLAGFYEKVVLCDNGSIDVWNEHSDGKETEKRNYPADAEHKAVLEKHVGPLKPGDIVDFEEIGEYKFVAKKRQ